MSSLVNRLAAAALAVVASVLVVPTANAEMPVSFEVGADYASKYVWRGQLLNDDPVVQPSATASWKGFTANVWASIDTTDFAGDDEEGKIQEIDYTLGYAFSPAEGLDLEVGGIYYDFPGAGVAGTSEVYASAAASAVPLTPTLTVYYDFDEVDGFYASAGIGHDLPLTDPLTLSLGAAIGWGDSDYNNAYFGVDGSGFSDASISASLTYAVTETFSVSGWVMAVEILDSDLEDAASTIYSDSDTIVTGLGVAFSF